MTIAKLPSGRWRARVWKDGRDLSVPEVLGLPKRTTWETKREARKAYEQARDLIRGNTHGVTVSEFWGRWTTDRLFARPKASTNRHNRERTKAFAERFGSLPVASVGDAVVGEWLAGGSRAGQVPALRAMFNDAMSAKAGRLTERNPFANLGLSRGRGNRDVQPPSEETVRALIREAHKQTGPFFAAWLQVAAFTGMRPGELDALRWDAIDFERSRILVAEQFSAGGRAFTLPKNGRRRWAILTPEAREALSGLPREPSGFCFVNLRGQHFTTSSRAYHWKAVRAAAGYDGTLYVATRHFAGWWMVNVLGLDSEDVAVALGHEDGGQLVRVLYGHRDRELALGRVLSAYERQQNVVSLTTRLATSEQKAKPNAG